MIVITVAQDHLELKWVISTNHTGRSQPPGACTKAVTMAAADPARGGSWDRGHIVPGLRALHLETAAGRRGAASHMLYYIVDDPPGGPRCIIILRLLHERMEPDLRLARPHGDRTA